MPIPFRSILSSAVANATFLDKTIDDVKKGLLGLYKVDPGESGAVIDVQNYLNEIADTSGQIFESDPNRKNYANENFISNGQSRKAAIEALDAQMLVNANAIATKLNRTAADFDTFAEKVTPVDDDIVLIEDSEDGFTKKKLRLENMIGGGGTGFGEIPTGTIDGVNTMFTISQAPLNATSVLVFVNGVNVEDQFSYAGSVVTLNTAPVIGQSVFVWYLTDGSPSVPSFTGTQNVRYITLNTTDITNEFYQLPNTPAVATQVIIDIIGAGAQQYAVDFTVSGDIINWSGLRLVNELVDGSVLRVQYLT